MKPFPMCPHETSVILLQDSHNAYFKQQGEIIIIYATPYPPQPS